MLFSFNYQDRDYDLGLPLDEVFQLIGLVFGPGVNTFAHGQSKSFDLWQPEFEARVHTRSLSPVLLEKTPFESSHQDFSSLFSLIRSSSSLSFLPPSFISSSYSSHSSSGSSSASIHSTSAESFLAEIRHLEYRGDQIYEQILQYFFDSCVVSMGWPLNGEQRLGEDVIFDRMKNSCIEDLLQPTSMPIASVAEVHIPARIGVMMISNVS